MKLNIKNLKGQVFQVDVQPADTVAVLKNKIQEAKGLAADTLKIVFKGKTVNAEQTIQKIGVKQTDFIVVMAQVAKPAPKPKQQTKPQLKQQPKPAEKKQQKPQSVPQNNNNETQINQLMSMGFPRQQCIAALRAAFNNTERAVQYLINGIPANIGSAPPPNAGQGGQGGLGGQSLGVNQLRSIFNHPQFAQIRDIIRQNPASIQPILAQIAQTSPQLYNLIAQHPEQFQRIIAGDDNQQGGQEQANVPNPPPGSIMITAEDQAAINRLKALGFSKIQSAQAYFACDKNEELAANLLFDRLANGDIQMQPQVPQGGQGGSGGNNPNEDDDNLFN